MGGTIWITTNFLDTHFSNGAESSETLKKTIFPYTTKDLLPHSQQQIFTKYFKISAINNDRSALKAYCWFLQQLRYVYGVQRERALVLSNVPDTLLFILTGNGG